MQPKPSLSEVHERIRSHADAGEWAEAERLCHQLFGMLPDHLLQGTALYWISVLRLQRRHNEACNVLYRYLRRLPWGHPVSGYQPAPVLVMHGLDSLRRCNVEFLSAPWEPLDFAIICGHFDSHTLLGRAGFAFDHLYIGPDLEEERFEDIRERLGNYQVIINSMADPACETPSLEMACSLLKDFDHVLNLPQLVLQAERDQLAECIREVPGICIPKLLRYDQVDAETRDSLHRWLEYSTAGLILRPIESQGGLGMERVVDPVMLDAWLDLRPDHGLFASEYYDFRDPHGLFQKLRVFVIKGQLMAEHLICARHWNLHSDDRYSLMDTTASLREAERSFLVDPEGLIGEQGVRALLAVAERTGLEYVGIDFSRLDNGELLLFEANPAMRLNYDHCETFPYLRPHLDTVSETFCDLVNSMLQ